jgi:hypothetical protein
LRRQLSSYSTIDRGVGNRPDVTIDWGRVLFESERRLRHSALAEPVLEGVGEGIFQRCNYVCFHNGCRRVLLLNFINRFCVSDIES